MSALHLSDVLMLSINIFMFGPLTSICYEHISAVVGCCRNSKDSADFRSVLLSLTYLDLVHPVPVGRSGDEVRPSLAVVGDFFYTSPLYSQAL